MFLRSNYNCLMNCGSNSSLSQTQLVKCSTLLFILLLYNVYLLSTILIVCMSYGKELKKSKEVAYNDLSSS